MGLALLYLVGGATGNTLLLATGEDYAEFADASPFGFVRDTWRSLVVPHHAFFIGLLIAFETAVGLLVLGSRRAAELGLVAALVFDVAFVSFGWGRLLWSVPMAAALVVLLVPLRDQPRRRDAGPALEDPTARPRVTLGPTRRTRSRTTLSS